MLDPVNRRGRAAVVRLLCSPLRNPNGDSQGALLMMEETKPEQPE